MAIKIGIVGLSRGLNFIKCAKLHGLDIVAICDKDQKRLDFAKNRCPETTKCFTDYDEFLKEDMDAVALINFFNEHTPFAIKAMEAGKDVLCECTAASTLAECVELVEAVERTGRHFMLAENYPFMQGPLEMHNLYKSGTLGRVLYSHGEYIHPGTLEDTNKFTRGEYHWRSWTPRTYYLTHSIGPLMFITDAYPKTVTAVSASAPELCKGTAKHTSDGIACMLCNMSDGSVCSFTGAGAIGGRGNWYRISCLNGFVETVRGDGDSVCLQYNPWEIPEGKFERQTYVPNIVGADHPAAVVRDAGHGGGDYWVMKQFKEYCEGKTQPYFDVYRSVQMSAIAILAWRSVLEGGTTKDIPDFKDKAVRELYRNDTLSPFPKADHTTDIPCSKQEYHPTEEDMEEARKTWKKYGIVEIND
ncbi:MAG: Gfo/Idh/MocA family oxidoreductase [Clostridia bacterium]|nr:Gfo/Idh/MocA family oxidoreductase [Clostridia bacterium]